MSEDGAEKEEGNEHRQEGRNRRNAAMPEDDRRHHPGERPSLRHENEPAQRAEGDGPVELPPGDGRAAAEPAIQRAADRARDRSLIGAHCEPVE